MEIDRQFVATRLSTLIGVMTGIALPAFFFGSAVSGAILGVVFLCFVVHPDRNAAWSHLKSGLRDPLAMLMFVTAVLWLPGVLFSIAPGKSFETWLRVLLFVVFGYLVWIHLQENRVVWQRAVQSLLLAITLTTALALISLFGPSDFIAWTRFIDNDIYHLKATVSLKSFGAMLMLLLPVVVWIGWRKGKPWNVLSLGLAGCFLLIIITLKNKSAVAGLLAAFLACFVVFVRVYGTRRQFYSSILVVGVIGAGLIHWLTPATKDIVVHSEVRFDYPLPLWLVDYTRQNIWGFVLDRAMESPFVGHGINAINLLPGADRPIHTGSVNLVPSHPHNWFLEIFSETGIVGLIPLLVLICATLVRLIRMYAATRDMAVMVALAVSVAYWASGLFNFSFWAAWWQVAYFITVAICLAGRGQDHPPATG